jgi:hypothetical protein
MMILPVEIEHALDVTVQRPHNADARQHVVSTLRDALLECSIFLQGDHGREPRKARQVPANHKRKPSVFVFE